MLQIGDNFSYKGQKPLDARIMVVDITALTSMPSTEIYNGILVYVISEKKYYTYNDTNTVDPVLDKWRELTAATSAINNAVIDAVSGSATYGHLILTLDDGTVFDCGNVIGPKGDQGQGFAITKLYDSIPAMLMDPTPTNDGSMVAVLDYNASGELEAHIFLRNSTQISTIPSGGNDRDGYTYFCDLADASIIQGPKGDKGDKGDKGETPSVSVTAIPATTTTPAGQKVTFTTTITTIDAVSGLPTPTTTTVTYNVYNGVDGLGVASAGFNANSELEFTMSDGSIINVGVIAPSAASSAVTLVGVFDNTTIPTPTAIGNIYYNKTTNKLHVATSLTAWDAGATPKNDVVYISAADRKVYAYVNGVMGIYGGDVDISVEVDNALVEKPDGLYVENLKPALDKINIAQKTVNEIGTTSLILNPVEVPFDGVANTAQAPALSQKTAEQTSVNKDVKLLDSIENYSRVRIIVRGAATQYSYGPKEFTYPVKYIKYNNANIVSTKNGSILDMAFDIRNQNDYADGSNHIVIRCWFKDDKTLRIDSVTTRMSGQFGPMEIVEVQGIKDQSITIDPINYLDTTQGIQDAPVGNIISYMGTNAPPHYLPCDGTIYLIDDYRILAQHIKNEFGQFDYWGGDGVTTFAVPDLRGEFLRGTGSNSHATTNVPSQGRSGILYEGSGAAVGKHQSATYIPKTYNYSNPSRVGIVAETVGYSNPNINVGYDATYTATGVRYVDIGFAAGNNRPAAQPQGGTIRPTNTSVLYCIKYEPTYFIGQITGYEEINELLLVPTEFNLPLNGELDHNVKISLKEPITGYDYIEVVSDTVMDNGKYTYPETERIKVSDIEFNVSDTDRSHATYLSYMMMPYQDKILMAGFAFNFHDASTLRVCQTRCARADLGTSWVARRIKNVRGIRTMSKIGGNS